MTVHKCNKETEIALMQQELRNQKILLLEIHSAVVGNDDKPGIKGRVGNIETSLNNTKVAGTFIAAIIAILMTILAFFKRS